MTTKMLAKYNYISYYLKAIVNLILKLLKWFWSKRERLISGKSGLTHMKVILSQ